MLGCREYAVHSMLLNSNIRRARPLLRVVWLSLALPRCPGFAHAYYCQTRRRLARSLYAAAVRLPAALSMCAERHHHYHGSCNQGQQAPPRWLRTSLQGEAQLSAVPELHRERRLEHAAAAYATAAVALTCPGSVGQSMPRLIARQGLMFLIPSSACAECLS